MLKKVIVMSIITAMMLALCVVTVEAASYSGVPSQIVCTPYGDLRYSVGVNWVTSSASQTSRAKVWERGKPETTKEYTGTAGQPGAPDTWWWHKIVLDELDAGTTYEYQVGDGTYWSGTNSFATAPEPDGLGSGYSFSFINLNDSQDPNGGQTHTIWGQTLARAAAKTSNEHAFVLHAGDHVDNGSNEDQWQAYFDQSQAVYNKSVLAGATGNHDAGSNSGSANKYQYRFNYDMPTDSPKATGMYYSFDYANAHFTVLNSQALNDSAQMEWLKYDVVKNARKWNVILLHNALYTNASHWAEYDVRNAFASTINDTLGVDVVFGGHDHIYNHTYPIRNGAPIAGAPKTSTTLRINNQNIAVDNLFTNPQGTVNYVNSTGSTKFYDYAPAAERMWFVPITGVGANQLGLQLEKPVFGIITVTNNELLNSAYYVDNNEDKLIETTGIKKDAPQISAPINVVRTYDAAARRLTITWDAPEGTSPRQYAVYDENNAYTQQFRTWFPTGRTQTIASLPQDVYDKTNFVVKAMGANTISEAGKPAVVAAPIADLTAYPGILKANLSWTAPSNATAQVLEISLNGTSGWTTLSAAAIVGGETDISGARLSAVLDSTSGAAEITGLKANVKYYFRLTVTGGANAGTYMSDATPSGDGGLAGTGNVLVELRNSSGVPYLNINDNVSANSCIAVKNNTLRSFKVPLIIEMYNANDVLVYLRFISGSTTLSAGQTIEVQLGSSVIDTANAKYLKVTPYMGGMFPLNPGNTALVLEKQ